MSTAEALEMVVQAEEWQLGELKAACAAELMTRVALDNVVRVLSVAVHSGDGLEELRQACLGFASQDTDEVLSHPKSREILQRDFELTMQLTKGMVKSLITNPPQSAHKRRRTV